MAKKFNLHHISTGDLLREKSKEDSELGKLIASLINAGRFVSDDLIYQVVVEEIKNNPDFILDGFPRTVKQFHMMSKLFETTENKPVAIILQVGMNISLERIRSRAEKENRADDSSNEILKIRMTEYLKKTQPIINHYRQFSNTIILNTDKAQEVVWEEFNKKYDEQKKLQENS